MRSACRALITDPLAGLQGPTSAGKTSLVAYLAAQTGHPFVRINNHEHTDLQVGAALLSFLNVFVWVLNVFV